MPSSGERYWGRHADRYTRAVTHVVGQELLSAISERLGTEPHQAQVIEMGCGNGLFTPVIAERADQLLATDLSEEMLGVARDQLVHLANVKWDMVDAMDTPYTDDRFDGVVVANLLHTVPNPLACITEAARILKPGGSLVAIDYTAAGMPLLSRARMGVRYLLTWGLPPRGGRSAMSCADLVLLARAAGLSMVTSERIERETHAILLRATKAASREIPLKERSVAAAASSMA